MLHNPYLLKRFGCSQHTNQISQENETDLSINRNINDNKDSVINGVEMSARSFCVVPYTFNSNCANSNGEDEEYDASINFSRFPNSSYMKMSVFKPSTETKKSKESTTYENSSNSISGKLINNVYNNRDDDFQNNSHKNNFKEIINKNNNLINYNKYNNEIQEYGKQHFEKVWEEKCCRKEEYDKVNCNDKFDLHTPPQKVFPLNGVMSCLASGNSAHSNDDSLYTNYNVVSSNNRKTEHAASTLSSSSLPPLHPSEQSHSNCNRQHRASLKKTSNTDNKGVNQYINYTKVEEYIHDDSTRRTHVSNVSDNSIDALQMWKEEQEEVSTNKVDENFVNDNSNIDNNTSDDQKAFIRAATRTGQTCKVKSRSESKKNDCKELDFCEMHSDDETQNENVLSNGVTDKKSKQNFDAIMNSLLGESKSVLSNANELLKQTEDRVACVNDELQKKIEDEYNLTSVEENRESNDKEKNVNSQHSQSERSNVNINDESNNIYKLIDTEHCTEEMDRIERMHSFVLNPPAALPVTLKEKIQSRIKSTTPSTASSTLLPKSSSLLEKASKPYKEYKIFELKAFNVNNCKERLEEKCWTSISSLESADTEHQQHNFKVDCEDNEIEHNVYTTNDVNEIDDIYFVSPASNDMEYNSFPMETEDENKEEVERNALRGNNNQNNNYRGQIAHTYNTERYYDGDEAGALHSSKLISKLTVKLTSDPERIMQCRLRRRGNIAERSKAQDYHKQELCNIEFCMPCKSGNSSNNYVEHVRSANEEYECQEKLLEYNEQGEIENGQNKNYELCNELEANTSTHILPESTQRTLQEKVKSDSLNEQEFNYHNKEHSDRFTNDVNKDKLKNSYCNHSMLNSKMPYYSKADESSYYDEEYDAEKKHLGSSAKMRSITPESNIDSLMHKLILFLHNDSKCPKCQEERNTGNDSTFKSASNNTEELCTRNKTCSAKTSLALTEQQSTPHSSDLLQRELQLCDNKNRNTHCEEEEQKQMNNKYINSDDNGKMKSLPISTKSLSPDKTIVEILEHDIINNNNNNDDDGNKKKKEEKKNKVKNKFKIEHSYTAPTQSSARKTVVRNSEETCDIFAKNNWL